MVDDEDLLTRDEVAELLGISLSTLERGMRAGLIRWTHRRGRKYLFTAQDVADYHGSWQPPLPTLSRHEVVPQQYRQEQADRLAAALEYIRTRAESNGGKQ